MVSCAPLSPFGVVDGSFGGGIDAGVRPAVGIVVVVPSLSPFDGPVTIARS